MRARRAEGGHPLDVAERLQQSEGFDDLGDACDAVAVSLGDLEKERGAFMTEEEVEVLRKLVEVLRKRRGLSQAAAAEPGDVPPSSAKPLA